MPASKGNPLAKAGTKRKISAETRQKLSAAAKKRHQRGDFDPVAVGKKGGRPKKARPAETISAALDDNIEDVIAVLARSTDQDEEIAYSTRLKAIQLWTDISHKNDTLSQREREADDRRQMTREELAAGIARMFTKGPAAATLSGLTQLEQDAGVVDADVVEDEDDGDNAAAAA